MRRYLIEFIGTFFLTIAVSFTGNPLAIGLMFMAMIYIGGHISGGHFNPAVTLALTLKGKSRTNVLPGYFLAQIGGALLAALLFYAATGDHACPRVFPDVSNWLAVLMEASLTFVFCATIIAVVLKNYKEVSGLVIGLTLAAIAFIGGVFNPAIAAGSMITSVLFKAEAICSMADLTVYLLAPFVGSLLAAGLWQIIED